MGPYRTSATHIATAPTRAGIIKVEFTGMEVHIHMDQRLVLTIAHGFVTRIRYVFGRARSHSMSLRNARILMAKGIPRGGVTLWYAHESGKIEKLLELLPVNKLDRASLRAAYALDDLIQELQEGIPGEDMAMAREYGQDSNRVILAEYHNGIELFVRPLMHKYHRRVCQVFDDGVIRIPHKNGNKEIRSFFRYMLSVTGDRIHFANSEGDDLNTLWLPWISAEDRENLAVQFAEQLNAAMPKQAQAALVGWAWPSLA